MLHSRRRPPPPASLRFRDVVVVTVSLLTLVAASYIFLFRSETVCGQQTIPVSKRHNARAAL